MSPRITRSSARQAASTTAASPAAQTTAGNGNPALAPNSEPSSLQASEFTPGLKRKASVNERSASSTSKSGPSARKHKRQKVPEPAATPLPNVSLAAAKTRRKEQKPS